jgi:hypothetical protein
MKRFLVVLAVLLTVVFMAVPEVRATDGTCTVAYSKEGNWIDVITFSCASAADDTSFPSTTTLPIRGWVFLAETNPADSITDNWDITLSNSQGVDIFGGGLLNRDTANTERAVPLLNSSPYPCWTTGILTMAASGNSVNAGSFTLKVWYYREQ